MTPMALPTVGGISGGRTRPMAQAIGRVRTEGRRAGGGSASREFAAKDAAKNAAKDVAKDRALRLRVRTRTTTGSST